MTIKVVSSTMGVSTPASIAEGTGWYRYNGSKPEPPPPSEPLPQNAKASEGKRKRFAEYTRLRLEGKTKEQAAAGCCPEGLAASTASYYEREFADQHPEVARDA